jgi:class 3 adenylate cyclase
LDGLPVSRAETRTCPWCGETIKAAARICRFCNRDIAAGEARFDADRVLKSLAQYLPDPLMRGILEGSAAMAEGERRPIAILFADLSGFTAMTERIGAEGMIDFFDRFHVGIQTVVAKYDGLVEKFIGDAVMALFGAPKAHGDDPERAIRAALDIRDFVRDLGAGLGCELDTHSGLAWGEVVFRSAGGKGVLDFQAIGDAVNLAARLQQQARQGQILADHRIWRQTRTTFRWEDHGSIHVKGRQDPVRIYRMAGVEKKFSKVTLGDRIELVEMVGRRHELDRLVECAEQAAGGPSQTLVVQGEAGVGKSRLVYEFYHHIEDRKYHWFTGRCLSYGGNIPLFPVAELFRSILRPAQAGEPDAGWRRIKQSLEALLRSSGGGAGGR